MKQILFKAPQYVNEEYVLAIEAGAGADRNRGEIARNAVWKNKFIINEY